MKKSVISSLNRKASFHRFVFISAGLACVLLVASAPALAAEDAFAVSVLPSGITSLAPRLAEVAGTFATYNIKPTLVAIERASLRSTRKRARSCGTICSRSSSRTGRR